MADNQNKMADNQNEMADNQNKMADIQKTKMEAGSGKALNLMSLNDNKVNI